MERDTVPTKERGKMAEKVRTSSSIAFSSKIVSKALKLRSWSALHDHIRVLELDVETTQKLLTLITRCEDLVLKHADIEAKTDREALLFNLSEYFEATLPGSGGDGGFTRSVGRRAEPWEARPDSAHRRLGSETRGEKAASSGHCR
jgi:hypothetical protein